MFCEGVVCVCIGVVLSYKYKYIYFALQKNNKKTNMRLMTVEECFFRCRLAVCSFFFSLNSYTTDGHARARIVLQGPALLRGHRSTGTVRIPTLGPRRCWVVTGKQSLFRTRVCDAWSKGGTSERWPKEAP